VLHTPEYRIAEAQGPRPLCRIFTSAGAGGFFFVPPTPLPYGPTFDDKFTRGLIMVGLSQGWGRRETVPPD
jgi:hypothetical protein